MPANPNDDMALAAPDPTTTPLLDQDLLTRLEQSLDRDMVTNDRWLAGWNYAAHDAARIVAERAATAPTDEELEETYRMAASTKGDPHGLFPDYFARQAGIAAVRAALQPAPAMDAIRIRNEVIEELLADRIGVDFEEYGLQEWLLDHKVLAGDL
jgi:hypothetical protein